MSRGPVPPEYVRKLPVYVPGKPVEEVRRELGITDEIVKLASNENPLGTSPKALAAVREALDDLHRYPDGGGFYLRQSIAARQGFPAEQIILGNGSVEIIEMLARAYLGDGDQAVFSEQSFVMYGIAIAAMNGKGIRVPATEDRRHDLDAMAEACTPETKLLFIANPSNPTGTYNSREEIDRLFSKIPDSVLVVVDQAYFEYIDRPDYPDCMEDLRNGRNVIVLRTFSKIYGLAGLRVGYGIADREVIDTLNRVRSPFNTSSLGQIAAIAALDDTEWETRSREENLRELDRVQAALEQRSVRFTPSVTNFVLVELDRDVRELFVELQKQGVIVRPQGGPGLDRCMRVSIGTRVENDRFLEALDALL
ncbi:MAG: histidinol-phosphate transaminase [Candidatus Eisenbacteria bacterium]|nr:histidinol-phosphate transaminase [Candidatus Latescibacterota bacterium]MBD3302673.1 histidinol-phosphate transaminase [Candidatus Eisenbacteria bacterium]